MTNSNLGALELFAGIGGFALAAGSRVRVLKAFDVNHHALGVYGENFPHPQWRGALESISPASFHSLQADLWWMSPPCQPFTRRGLRKDQEDPRAKALLHLIEVLKAGGPTYLALENVEGFESSECFRGLREVLRVKGYQVLTYLLCPSDFGIPNRRPRFYLVASSADDLQKIPLEPHGFSLQSRTQGNFDPELLLPSEVVRDYSGALHLVDRLDPEARTTCFTSAYGHSWVRSGSYLQTDRGPRLFSPSEILALLGFPTQFKLPASLSRRQQWKLVGNSLSIVPVRHILASIPQFRGVERISGC